MEKSKKYRISAEILKFLFSAKSTESIEWEEFLSKKICSYTIKIRKKLLKKWNKYYGQLVFSISNLTVSRSF